MGINKNIRLISYSQNFEDVMLWRVFKNIKNGIYIDIGANDPIIDSVTKLFYINGWRGVNIEPIEYWFSRLILDRPKDINLQIAVSNKVGNYNFFEIIDTGLSTFSKKNADSYKKKGFNYKLIKVKTKTLKQICEECNIKEIHFLKIDVEGHEKEVLEGGDFDLFRPWVILIESNVPLSVTDQDYYSWEHILLDNGYDFVYYDGLNRYYVDQNQQLLKKYFNLPPNVFDNFIRYQDWKKQTDLELIIDSIYKSYTWRFTYPFRILFRRLKKIIEKINS